MRGLKLGKNMVRFGNYKLIVDLESKGDFLMVIDYLYKDWIQNQTDGKLMVRLAFECWYALSESYRLELAESECKRAKEILIQVKNKIVENGVKDAYVLSHMGYMITMFPEFFYCGDSEDLYNKHQLIGAKMLQDAVEISPENKIAQLFMLGINRKEKAYNKLKKQLKSQIQQEYNGEDCFDEYFRDVLTQE